MKFLPLILALALSSCSSSEKDNSEKKEESKEKEKKVQKQIIGRIASVSATGGFVLIQKYGAGKMPLNAIIQSAGPDGRNASLRPSGERVQNFFAADLVNGEVEIGDAVVAYYDQKPQEDITPIKEENPPKTSDSPEKPEDSGPPGEEKEN